MAAIKQIIIPVIAIVLIIFGCSCNDYGTHGTNIFNGNVQFEQMDTSLLSQGGGYFAAAFFDGDTSISLYYGKPFIFKLNPVKSGDKYSAAFSSGSSLGFNTYYVAAVWIKEPYHEMDQKPVLGTFGCDTNRDCSNFTKADGTNNPINFHAYGDTSKLIFYNIPRN